MLRLPGGSELIIILIIVILLFGVGRISKVAGEFGKGIRAFKDGLHGLSEDKQPKTAASEEINHKPV